MQCLGLGFKRETQAPEGGKGKFYEHWKCLTLLHQYSLLITLLDDSYMTTLSKQEHELEDEDVVQIIKKV